MAKGTEVLTNQYHGEPFTYDPEFRGPVKNRSCTDILCLFLFLAFIAGWIVVAGFAYKHGDPRQLLYPTDSEGRICGKGEFENKPYLFFFDLTKCIRGISSVLQGCPTPQVCVTSCPNNTFSTYPYVYTDVISLKTTDEIKKLKEKMICKNESLKNTRTIESLVKSGNCAPFYLKSSPLGGRCIPELFTKIGSTVIDDLSEDSLKDENGNNITTSVVEKAGKALALILNARQVGERIFQDFSRVWWILIVLLLVSMVLSFIWILLMRLVAGVMVWLSIVCVTGLLGFGCYYSVKKYISLKNQPGSDAAFSFTTNLKSYLALRDTWLAFAIISGVLLIILLLLLIFLRKRILIAIALIKEGSRAVGTMMSSLFFPIVPYVFLFALFVFWGSVAMYIASAGRPSYRIASNGSTELDLKIGNKCDPKNFDETEEQNGIMCIFTSYDGDPNLFRAQVYNLFGLFWAMFFIVGVGQVSLAGAFASYYWTFNKPKDVPSFAVGLGLWRCTRYHLGSVAFGSLIIAIVRMIRVMLEYVDHKLKKYDNKVAKFALWCCKCCFWCLEKFLRFINKNAYIMIAVYGKNFCSSAKDAFLLLMRNIVRVVVLDKTTDFLLFLGKLVVVGASALAAFYIFSGEVEISQIDGVTNLNYYLLPVITITIGSYIIASGFFSVYGMAVDTLFLCFLEDCERNDGSEEKPYYMSKELMKILDKKNKFQNSE